MAVSRIGVAPRTPECWAERHDHCGLVVSAHLGPGLEPVVNYCRCECHFPSPEVVEQAIREIVAMLNDIPLKFVRPNAEGSTGAVD